MNSLRSVAVQFQYDSESPLLSMTVNYGVSESETEVVFPNGEKKAFKNWDVRGVRETFYKEDILKAPVEELTPSQISNSTLGIRPDDVSRFVRTLAQKSQYEHLFESEFHQMVEIPAEQEIPVTVAEVAAEPVKATPAPQVKQTAVKGARKKFPYIEVARLWNEGRSLMEIASEISYLDRGKVGNAATHTLRTFLTKMHAGYIDENGNRVVLPYRERKSMKAVAGA